MTTVPLLDTHAWIWWVQGDARLGSQALRALDQLPKKVRPAISDISLWEVATLVSLGRVELKRTLDAWLALAAHPNTVRVLPITSRIAVEVARLPDSFQRDPADRVIVSTSRVHGLPVLTRDAAIATSGLVRLWLPDGAHPPFRDALPKIYELEGMLKHSAHPDAYFQDFENSLKKRPSKLDAFLKLERQLAALDDDAWTHLKQKASRCVISRERNRGRGWKALFEALNEAKGVAWLQRLGCTGVHFIPEDQKKRTPDLGAVLDGLPVLCEVKTINVSDIEADSRRRIAQGGVVVGHVRNRLDEGFLRRLRSTLDGAVKQLDGHDPRRIARRIVLVVLNFDDWVGDSQEEYFRQIDEDLLEHAITGAELVVCPAANLFERNFTMKSAAVFLE